jgi:hypothetical protein
MARFTLNSFCHKKLQIMGSVKHTTLNQNGKGIMKTTNKIKIKPMAAHYSGEPVSSPKMKSINIQYVFSAPIKIGIGQNPRIPDSAHPVDAVLPVVAAGSSTTTMAKL